MHGLLQDIRYALRGMTKARGVTLVAVITLALGIGANTAIFSVFNSLLLRPLPYPASERLVMVWRDMTARGGPATEWTGPAQHFDWKAQTRVFESVSTLRGWNATLSGGTLAESILGEQTTYEYFDTLGVHPALGRVFQQADDVPNAARVVILSHALWQQRFGGDRAIVGRVIPINGEDHEVIGVMPAGFRPVLATTAAIWRPLRWNPSNPPRNVAIAHTVGRLQPGLSLAQARAALDAAAKGFQQAYPQTDAGSGINPVPLREQQVGGVRTALFVLLGAVGSVLLIACVNVANLLLSRASGRTREMAVRRALGADRMRIVRQLLTESLVLALTGGAVGVLLGVWGVSALKAIAPDGTPRLDEIGVDRVVLAFAAALSLATGLVFGLVPAWQAGRDQFTAALKQGGRGATGDGGGRARRVLIVAEFALALMLLVGGGLLIRTVVALQRADLGFNPDHVLTGFVLPPAVKYRTDAQRRAFYDALLERTASLPGVTQAALSSVIPLGGDSDTNVEIEGRAAPATSADTPVIWYRDVSAGYFAAMNIRLRRGRTFGAGEMTPLVVINETAAKTFWPNEDPLGKRMRFGRDSPWFAVSGIVGDVQVRGAREAHRVEAYVPYWLNPETGINIVLKTAQEPASLIEPLKRAVKDLDPGMAVASATTMDAMIAESNGASRFYATLVGIFAGLALLLAAVGIYGVMSYAVAQRTQEIGVRLALGAAERQIFGLVVGDSLKLAALGLGLGLAGAFLVGRGLEKLLFGVAATDLLTFGATIAILMAVAFLASYLPARRAMRVDPMTALRVE